MSTFFTEHIILSTMHDSQVSENGVFNRGHENPMIKLYGDEPIHMSCIFENSVFSQVLRVTPDRPTSTVFSILKVV